jgi:hypothetical protein
LRGFSLFTLPAVFGGRELSVMVWRFELPEDCTTLLGRIGVTGQGAGVTEVQKRKKTLRVKRQSPLECILVETGAEDLEPALQEVIFGPKK